MLGVAFSLTSFESPSPMLPPYQLSSKDRMTQGSGVSWWVSVCLFGSLAAVRLGSAALVV